MPTTDASTPSAPRDDREPPIILQYLGGFLTFATLGIFLDICMVAPRPWYGVAIMSALTGLISVGWMYAYRATRKVLFFVIPASFIVPIFIDILFPSQALARYLRAGLNNRLLVEVIICAAMFSVGYACYVHYIRRQYARHHRLRTEIALAKRIHDMLVPPITRRTPTLEIYGRSAASSEMGGDLLDIDDQPNALTLFIADVSGHGVAAGVLMGMVKSAIHMRLRAGAGLADLTTDLNRVVAKLVRPGVFVTFACIRFDNSDRAEYALAGHLPILQFRAATSDVIELGNESLPLGVSEDESFEVRSAEAMPDDLFVLLTDGLMETMDSQDRLFGDPRIREIIARHARQPLPAIYDTLMSAVRAHGRQTDDQTILLARVRPPTA